MNTDLAPTWLARFGVRLPADLTGRPMVVDARDEPPWVDLINDVHNRIYETEMHRLPATRTAISLMMLAMALAALAMMLGERLRKWLRWVLGFALGIVVALPLLHLTDPSLLDRVGSVSVLWIIALWVLIGAMGGIKVLAFMAACYTVLLPLDLATGGQLLGNTVFSHSIPSGARYYGIGNELGGFLAAAALIALLGWDTGQAPPSRRTLGLIAVGMIVLLALIGLPFLGANFGIMLGGAVAFAAAFARLCGARLTLKTAGLGLLMIVLIIGGVVVIDLLRGAGGSHIGRAFGGANHAGLWVIMGRKLATNWRVFQVSLWSRLLGLAVACLIAAAVWLPPAVRAAYERHRNLGAIMTGIGWGSLALFLLNDSGVVAAALALTLGATYLSWCALEQPKQATLPKPSG